MGKKKPKQEVNEYYMSQHVGICSRVDAVTHITIGDKKAWEGDVTENTDIAINQRELFGGVKKEGGVAGIVTALFGGPDQVLPDDLATKLGRASGADCPGFRGVTSLFFAGRKTGITLTGVFLELASTKLNLVGNRGFYWTANTPYLKNLAVGVRRAPVGLTAAYAMIDTRGTADPFPFEEYDTGLGAPSRLWNFTFNAAYTRLLWSDGTNIEIWDNEDREQVYSGTLAAPINAFTSRLGLRDDGSFLAVSSSRATLYEFTTNGLTYEPIFSFPQAQEEVRLLVDGKGDEHWLTIPYSFLRYHYIDGVEYFSDTATGYMFSVAEWLVDGYGDIWGVGRHIGPFVDATELYFWRVVDCGEGPVRADFNIVTMPSGGSGASVSAVHSMVDGHFVARWNGTLYAIDDTDFSIKTSAAFTFDTYNASKQFANHLPGASSLWLNNTEIDLTDLSTIRTVTMTDWSGSTDADGIIYDPLNVALITAPQSGNLIDWRFLTPRGGQDANPAHIIYECLTNSEWGMGAPEALLDTAAFEAAGVTLFNEGLGLSLRWTQQDMIENFVSEIIDHIQATLFVNPRTGLLTLTLIRDDYDVETLREITPDNADINDFQRKGWGEIINEIVVTWTNPDNEQDETVIAQDNGAIAAQNGKVISSSRNYYGVRTSDLAMQLAQRDLRASSAPLASCEVELDRSAWDLLPGDVVKVTWPEHGLNGVVMRVGPVDYGNLGNPVIKASLVEDVFSFATAEYEAPTGSAWAEEGADPEPVTYSRVITIPAFLAANYLAEAGLDTTIEYPEVIAGVLASTDDGYNFDLWATTVQPDGTEIGEVQTTCTMVGHASLGDVLAAESASTGVTLTGLVGSVSPASGIVMLIGDDSDTDAEMEIALISDATSGIYTINRGLLDTVPRAWAAGTTVWLFSIDSDISDLDLKSDTEEVSYKVLTRTFAGLLDPFDAPVLTGTLNGRPHYPTRPADVKVDGTGFGTVNCVGYSTIPVTWSNRNRLTEDSQILLWTDGSVTPETGQTTTITVTDVDGNVTDTITGLTGTSYDVPLASFGGRSTGIIRVTSERDGLESLQGHEITVLVASGYGYAYGYNYGGA